MFCRSLCRGLRSLGLRTLAGAAALLTASTAEAGWSLFDRAPVDSGEPAAVAPQDTWTMRGQSPTVFPQSDFPAAPAFPAQQPAPGPTYSQPYISQQPGPNGLPPGGTFSPSPVAPLMDDPNAVFGPYGFDPATGAGQFNPYAPQFGGTWNPNGPRNEAFGIHGPQPYRFGWREEMNVLINSSGDTSPDIGGFKYNEFNALKEYTNRGPGGWIYTLAPELNYRWIEGPAGPPGLPADVWRLGLGGKLASPIEDGFSIELGFAPKLATDFAGSLDSNAWQWDASAIGYLQARPDLMLVFGVQYWDRVDDLFIPTAGIVYNASDVLEIRATFPKASIDLFLGTPFGAPTWVYLNGEYRVESYQVEITPPFAAGQTIRDNAFQIEDWRLMLGTRWESGWLVSFVEAGIILDREIEFDRRGTGVQDFDVDESFVGRVGFKW